MTRPPVILTIAGHDPTGGAGISADQKTIHALGGYAASVLTTVTAQNSQGVAAVHPLPIDVLCAQLDAVFEEFSPAAVKVGLLATRGQIEAVVDRLKQSEAPVIVDPVAAASAGGRLTVEDTADALREKLLPLSACVCPNLDEARALARDPVTTNQSSLGHRLRAMSGAHSVLVTGGDIFAGTTVVDVWCGADGATEQFSHPRLGSTSTHGTGCTLTAALATAIGQDMPLLDAVARAIDYTTQAIAAGPDLGVSRGPVGHPRAS